MAESPATAANPLIATYGRRRGRALRTHKQELFETLLPRVSIDADAPLDPRALFPDTTALRVELGFGYGEHLATQASRHPQTGFIGCEPYMNGIADLLADIERLNLANVRIYPGDGRRVLEQLPQGSIDRIDILFPDPWPKARHHKRRLVCRDTLTLLHAKMKPGAALRLATDHEDYAAWMCEHLLLSRDLFRWTAEDADDFRRPPADWVETRYQLKARAEGREPVWLIAERR